MVEAGQVVAIPSQWRWELTLLTSLVGSGVQWQDVLRWAGKPARWVILQKDLLFDIRSCWAMSFSALLIRKHPKRKWRGSRQLRFWRSSLWWQTVSMSWSGGMWQRNLWPICLATKLLLLDEAFMLWWRDQDGVARLVSGHSSVAGLMTFHHV